MLLLKQVLPLSPLTEPGWNLVLLLQHRSVPVLTQAGLLFPESLFWQAPASSPEPSPLSILHQSLPGHREMRPPAGSILLPLHQAGPVRSPPGLNHSPVHFLLLRSGFWMLPAGLPDCPPAPDKRKPVLPEPPGLPRNMCLKLVPAHTAPATRQADFWHSLTGPLLRKAVPPAAQSGQVPDCSFPFWHLSPVWLLQSALCLTGSAPFHCQVPAGSG